MDYDRLTQLLESDDIQCAEIVTYHSTKKGLIRKTTTIDYFGGGDYQWSSTSKPITID
jgi:hypothetical protein